LKHCWTGLAGSYIFVVNTVRFTCLLIQALTPVFRSWRLRLLGPPRNPSRLGNSCLLLKHASPACCPKNLVQGEQSRLYAYRHAHPFSRATQQSLRPGFDPASSLLSCELCNSVHQESEPIEGVRFLEPAVTTAHYAPQPQGDCFALPVRVSPRQADRVLQDGPDQVPRRAI